MKLQRFAIPIGCYLCIACSAGGGSEQTPPAPTPTISVFAGQVTKTASKAASRAFVFENAGVAVFTIQLSSPTSTQVSVTIRTAADTATPADFSVNTAKIVFQPGETLATVSVKVVDDSLFELEESFKMVLSDPVGATLGQSTAYAVIINDDPLPVFSITATPPSAFEPAVKAPRTVRITRSPAAGAISSVRVTTTGGNATSGIDYEPINAVIQFAAGETVQDVSIQILPDSAVEPNETITVTLSEPLNATLSQSQTATVTIQDEDATTTPVATSSYGALSVTWPNAPNSPGYKLYIGDQPGNTVFSIDNPVRPVTIVPSRPGPYYFRVAVKISGVEQPPRTETAADYVGPTISVKPGSPASPNRARNRIGAANGRSLNLITAVVENVAVFAPNQSDDGAISAAQKAYMCIRNGAPGDTWPATGIEVTGFPPPSGKTFIEPPYCGELDRVNLTLPVMSSDGSHVGYTEVGNSASYKTRLSDLQRTGLCINFLLNPTGTSSVCGSTATPDLGVFVSGTTIIANGTTSTWPSGRAPKNAALSPSGRYLIYSHEALNKNLYAYIFDRQSGLERAVLRNCKGQEAIVQREVAVTDLGQAIVLPAADWSPCPGPLGSGEGVMVEGLFGP